MVGTPQPAWGKVTGMENDVSAVAKSLATQNAPWKKGLGWQVLGIEGIVALGIGIYVLAAPDSSRDIIRQLIAAILFIQALLHTLAGFRNREQPVSSFHILRGGIGMTVGVIVLLENVSDYLTADSSRLILGLGLIAYGAIGIIGIWVEREDRGLRFGGLAAGIINIVLGLMFAFSKAGDRSDSWLRALGVIAVIAGIVLLAYAFMVYKSLKSGSTPDAPVAGSAGD